ncbi:copper transporter [Russula decolorans]
MSQTSSSSELGLMTHYLHLTGRRDYLCFKSWHTSSHGAIAETSIALVILAVLERLLYATREAMVYSMSFTTTLIRSVWFGALTLEDQLPTGDRTFLWKKQEKRVPRLILSIQRKCLAMHKGVGLAFQVSRDATRGVLYSLQASLVYAPMLAVMTFQAAYIISNIVGLGLGEVLFGRLAYAHL